MVAPFRGPIGEAAVPAVLDAIVERVRTLPVTPAHRLAATHAIADTLACMVAGRDDPSTVAVRRGTAGELGNGSATLVGGGSAQPAPAALLNGTAAHALDFDDNFNPGMSHASAVMVPAILAVGEAEGIGGAALVDAYLAGLEAQALVGRAIGREHYVAGWHGTSTVGAIGSAAGVAHVLGLGHDEIVQAMSLATSTAAGPKGQLGSPAKPFHAGMAARNAVQAAYLAQAGLTGRPDILERGMGFFDLTNGGGTADWEIPGPEVPHAIEAYGLAPKIHPCCGATHNSLDMVLDLRHAHGFAPDDVEAVTLTVGRANVRNLAYPDPTSETEARFSMPYCIALALHDDRLSLSDFQPGAYERAHLRELFPRIAMELMPIEEERAAARPPHTARVVLKDGQTFQTQRAHAKGTIHEPLDDAARTAKIADCFAFARVPFTPDIATAFETIDGLADLAPLAAVIAMAPQPAA